MVDVLNPPSSLQQAFGYKNMKIYLYNVGHMTKMATMSMKGKTPLKIFFPKTSGSNLTKHDILLRRIKPIIICLKNIPWLTLTYFITSSNFAT